VIAAGSLLDFAIEKVGVPVGRVSFLYMYPMSVHTMKMNYIANIYSETAFARRNDGTILFANLNTMPLRK
jgi:hypothetical protein